MHPNTVFHDRSAAENAAWARERAFGVLAAHHDGPPLLAHVPFLLSEDDQFADLHLVRSNPIARALKAGPAPARLAVSGADSYVSPDWYESDGQVPTWNYVAVHLTGMLELLPDADLVPLLESQSDFFETRLAPKPPWTLDKTPKDVLDKLLRAILPVRLRITSIEGTWKLNQNKTDADRMAAAGHIETDGVGTELRTLAALTRGK